MANQGYGFHHLHRRKRIHQQHEPYPHPNKWKRFLDKIIFVVGVIGPLMVLPQVLKIWIQKDASGVSLISWASFLFFDTIWITYGVVHRVYPIIVAYTIWIILEIVIVIGILRYGTGFF